MTATTFHANMSHVLDQPAHPSNLINAFVICQAGRMISLVHILDFRLLSCLVFLSLFPFPLENILSRTEQNTTFILETLRPLAGGICEARHSILCRTLSEANVRITSPCDSYPLSIYSKTGV